jgi:hypothetical protein
MRKVKSVAEEIIDVVGTVDQGTPGESMSLYVLIPKKLRTRLGIGEDSQFVVILAKNGDIIYRKKEA